jgi:hypothetical protein
LDTPKDKAIVWRIWRTNPYFRKIYLLIPLYVIGIWDFLLSDDSVYELIPSPANIILHFVLTIFVYLSFLWFGSMLSMASALAYRESFNAILVTSIVSFFAVFLWGIIVGDRLYEINYRPPSILIPTMLVILGYPIGLGWIAMHLTYYFAKHPLVELPGGRDNL